MHVSHLGAAIAAVLSTVASAAAVDCTPPERTLFSCSTGTKKVSVCSSEGTAGAPSLLQYRFGRPAAVELSYPPAGADWREVVSGGTLTFSGGGGAFLAFAKEPYRYVVYSAVGRGWGSRAGVVVEREGKQIAHLPCLGNAISELGPDLFSTADIKVVDDGFVLP